MGDGMSDGDERREERAEAIKLQGALKEAFVKDIKSLCRRIEELDTAIRAYDMDMTEKRTQLRKLENELKEKLG